MPAVPFELEDMSFRYLQPDEYNHIERLINKDNEEREKYIQEVKSYIEEKMASSGLACEVLGRRGGPQAVRLLSKTVASDINAEVRLERTTSGTSPATTSTRTGSAARPANRRRDWIPRRVRAVIADAAAATVTSRTKATTER